ncbi:penicillin-binding protein [Paenibacillus sp. J23TS9]|uniref:serine hydrolase domain-containing protein n=1 Tax=Paenibacillus sp. J23TS9 TaxID=2807193 RepID=UPI001B0E2CEB|nr:serine hydrolase [Paenibacillus sp. J23TS9]GIP30021.1 penicillin-binding protein [Paenibacillus sp. J23TS9]
MLISLDGFVNRVTQQGLNVLSVRVLLKGTSVAKWDLSSDERRLQHSVSKSFTCMAVGMAIAEGKLSLETKLQEYFPQYAQMSLTDDPDLRPGGLTLYNLLRMSSGHDSPPLWAEERASLQEKDWVKYYMSLPLDRAPGDIFTYSSGDTFIISALVQAAVGQTVKDYLTPRLFEPLGIQDVNWETSPLGVTLGCAGLEISNEELSRFGQMLLQKGQWDGKQLVPADWIDFVTRKQIDNQGSPDWSQGYGCQFWMCTHEAYRADGAHGQLCVVIPGKDAVVAINSYEDDIQGILDAVWAEILPLL